MKAAFEVGAAGKLLEERLEKVGVGEVISYEEMSKAACVDDVREHRSVVRGAVKRLRARSRMVFATVVRQGLKRLDDAGKVAEVLSRSGSVLEEVTGADALERAERLRESIERGRARAAGGDR